MSADNFIAVVKKDDKTYLVTEGSASVEAEDCQYIGGTVSTHTTREQALVAAHDLYKSMYIVEYGVCEMAYPGPHCGRCYVCINERGEVSPNVERCDACNEPITTSDTMVLTGGNTYHSRCERKLSYG